MADLNPTERIILRTPADVERSLPAEVQRRALRAGTLDKIDRSRQYSSAEHATPIALLTAVNAQGNHIRGLQVDHSTIRKEMNLKLRNAIVVAIVGAVIGNASAIVQFILKVFR